MTLTVRSYIASMGTSSFYSNSTNTTSDGINYYLTRVPCDSNVSCLPFVCFTADGERDRRDLT